MSITVINPNSNPVYTEQMSAALDSIRRTRNVSIDCLTLENAPLAIESDDDVQAVIEPLCTVVEHLDGSVNGVVIACFADPGLEESRALGRLPVIGCCEAAVDEAVLHGTSLGLISTGDDVAGDRDLMLSYHDRIENILVQSPGIPTPEMPTHPQAMERMAACGNALQREGAAAVVLGCAGMARYFEALQDMLSVPVIEPVASAVNLLLASIESDRVSRYAAH